MNRINVYNYEYDEYTGKGKELVGWFDLDTAEAIDETTRWDGHNLASVHCGDHTHQILYHTKSGRWILHTWSEWQGTEPTYEFLDDEAARKWLLINNSDDIIEHHLGPIEPERGPGGRPPIGPAINMRLAETTITALDTRAATEGTTRADLIRRLIDEGLAA